MRANRSTLAKLCLLTALAVPVQRTASATEANRAIALSAGNSTALIAQTETFTPPAALDNGASLTIDGSSSMRAMNEALAEQFQERYADASVESTASDTETALNRLRDGEIDLAAIGRPLTDAESAIGFEAVDVAREKIAIFVGPENGFDGDLTFEQFGQIFRGEITDWSEVGGEPRPIRFIDRPDFSDTRAAFNQYPTFQQAPFETGTTAEPVAEDETEAVIAQLEDDGIGYAIANQVLGNDAVKIVPMHQTLPDNPAYPYSQPRSYVYFGELTPAAEGFLAVATGEEGQAVAEAVSETEGAALAQLDGVAPEATTSDGNLVARTNEDNVAIIEDAGGNLVAGPLAAAGGAVTALAFSPDGQTLATGTNTGRVRYWDTASGEAQGEAFNAGLGSSITDLSFVENDQLSVEVADQNRTGFWGLNGEPYGEDSSPVGTVVATGTEPDGVPWWLWLIPLLGLFGVGLWWLLSRNRETTTPEPRRQTAPTATVPPPATDPDSDREVSNRAQTVIKTDRVTDESRTVMPSAELPGAPTIPDAPAIPVAQPSVSEPDLPEFESTDLEEPEIDDRNLDLRTAGLAGGAALGGIAAAGGAFALGTEDEDEDEDYDANLDLTLDNSDVADSDVADVGVADVGIVSLDAPDSADAETASSDTTDVADAETAIETAEFDAPNAARVEPAGLDSPGIDDGSDVAAVSSNAPNAASVATSSTTDSTANNLDDIEPTRDTVIAESNDVPDIEPDSQTIIGDSTVIFRGAATDDEPAAAASPDIAAASFGSTASDSREISGGDIASDATSGRLASESTVSDEASTAIDSFFSDSSDVPETPEDTVEAGLSPVLQDTVSENPVTEETVLDSTVVLGSAAAGIAGSTINTIPLRSETEQSEPEQTLDVQNTERQDTDDRNLEISDDALVDRDVSGSLAETSPTETQTPRRTYTTAELASVDEDLPELPEGYGESRIVLLPRDPKWAYAYWDVSNEHKEELRRQGGQQLALRLYDVTEIDQNHQQPHSLHQQNCDEMARSWYLEIPVSDRDYTAEIGYLTGDGRWLMLCRSAPIRVPPIYPSDWINDQFVTIGFDESLVGRTFGDLGRQPSEFDIDSPAEGLPPIYDELFAMTQGQNALRVAGSLFGSMHQVAPGALTPSGSVSGLAFNQSGLNVSGLNMSGVGLPRKRNFWLVADAELIVYGATEPDATLTIGDRVIPLTADGTFRFHIHFPDGKIDYPIRAVAADGEQSRSISMKFERGTPERNTNTKEDAQDEWF